MSVPVVKSSKIGNALLPLDKKHAKPPITPAKNSVQKIPSPVISDKNYPVGKIENHIPPPKTPPINDILINGLTLGDLQYGIKKIITPKNNVLSIISKSIHTDTATLTSKMGNIDALQTAYNNAQFSMGVGFVCSGMGGLLRLGTNIFDLSVNHLRKSANKKPVKPCNTHRTITHTADILSSIGNLISVKNMVYALRTPNVIPQALTAFGGGVTASVASVTAIQAGVGLLAAGVTISSLKTLLNVANDIFHGDKIPDKQADKPTQKPSIHSSLVSATENFSKGIGNIILLQSPAGFSMSNLLNWDNNMIPFKPLEWLNTTSLVFAGTKDLKNAAEGIRQ